jgi:hypothetical protein
MIEQERQDFILGSFNIHLKKVKLGVIQFGHHA